MPIKSKDYADIPEVKFRPSQILVRALLQERASATSIIIMASNHTPQQALYVVCRAPKISQVSNEGLVLEHDFPDIEVGDILIAPQYCGIPVKGLIPEQTHYLLDVDTDILAHIPQATTRAKDIYAYHCATDNQGQ